MKKLKSTLLVLLMACVCLVIYYAFVAMTDGGIKMYDELASERKTGQNSQQAEVAGDEEETVVVSLVAVGDNFTHESVINSGRTADGGYNYDFLFTNIKNYVESADIATIFQTMIIAGNDSGVSGYPIFNAPQEMMLAIDNAGFDVALMASNHTNDMGTEGIFNCKSLWNQTTDVLPVGICTSEEDVINIPILNVKGKKIAILNYTTDMNSPIESEENQYMVKYLGALNTSTGNVSGTNLSESVLNDIRRASDQADCVIVFPYWGKEYNFDAGSTQQKWAKAMTEAGADLIIGARSHYIGDVEEITADNGNKSLCYYSLGNFVSSFNDPNAMIGGMARVNIVFQGDEVYVDKSASGIMPLITHYTHSGNDADEDAVIAAVMPISLYSSDMAQNHGIITRAGAAFSMDMIQEIITSNVSQQYLMTE